MRHSLKLISISPQQISGMRKTMNNQKRYIQLAIVYIADARASVTVSLYTICIHIQTRNRCDIQLIYSIQHKIQRITSCKIKEQTYRLAYKSGYPYIEMKFASMRQRAIRRVVSIDDKTSACMVNCSAICCLLQRNLEMVQLFANAHAWPSKLTFQV